MSAAMQTPPPLPVDYRRYQTPEPGNNGRRFFAALMIGTAISAIAWTAGWKSIERGGVAVVLLGVIPLAKFIVGITLVCFRGRRSFGAGLLASIGVGFLIFFTNCATRLRL
jgi:hypothetical protein